jgi:hypothetical protein
MPNFSNQTAADLAQLIDYAYALAAGAVPGNYPPPLPPGFPSNYTLVALAQATDDFWGYKNLQYYGIVAQSSTQIVIAIRGTGDITEWLIDFEFPLKTFTTISGAGSVEDGFFSVFSSLSFVTLQGQAVDLPGYLANALAANPNLQIVVEGHSLGGAIVSMLALSLAYNNQQIKTATIVYTFASPAPGDGTFASFYDAHAPVTFRVWNPWDLVPSAPPSFLGYQQVANGGIKLAPTIQQLEQYDFLSVDCNHSLKTYQWLLDSQYPLLSSCEWGGAKAAPPSAADRAVRLQASLARMSARAGTGGKL